MTSTLLVASAVAPSVQSSMILKETFRPFLSKIESEAVSSPPLATSPAAHPTQTFRRTRIGGLSVVELTGSGSDVFTFWLLPLLEPWLPPLILLKSMTPYFHSPYPTSASPTTKITNQPPFSIFTAMCSPPD